MLVLVCIVHLLILFCFTFPLNFKGLNRQNCSRHNYAQATHIRCLYYFTRVGKKCWDVLNIH